MSGEVHTDWRKWLLLVSAFVVALDRATKIWIDHHMETGDAIPVIPHFFRISHVLNSGAAFSIFENTANPQRTKWMLIGFSVIAAIAVFVFLLRIGRALTATSLAMALILGGAIGNVYDRVAYGTVTDFLEVHIFSYHWPDFNVADSAIVIGGILILLDSLRPTRTPSKTAQV
jgi:signal peptidase II